MKLTITEMKKRNQEAGQYWFSKETMDFFGCVIEAGPNIKNIFITSEWNFDRTERYYTLRRFDTKTNTVETIGEFQQYKTLLEARAARRAWKGG